MPVEQRLRITIILPAPTDLGHFLLLEKILTGLARVCGGVTVSPRLPSAFEGRWIDDASQTIEDESVLIMADAPSGSQRITAYLETLKRHCQMDFNQAVVWVTTHPVERITTDDGVR